MGRGAGRKGQGVGGDVVHRAHVLAQACDQGAYAGDVGGLMVEEVRCQGGVG